MKKYVLAQPGGFNYSLKEIVTAIKEAGFDGVFFTLEYEGLDDSLISYTKEIGLDIETIHLPYSHRLINNLWDEKVDATSSLKKLMEGIDFAYSHQVKTVILHTVNGFNAPLPSEYGLNNYRILAEHCRNKGIILALENNKSMLHLQYLLDGLKEFDNVKLCFDIGHANAFTKNLDITVWDKLLNNLWCVHIHDNNGLDDEHLIPYLGNIDYKYWIKQLINHQNNLNLTLEIYYMNRQKYYGQITPKDFYLKSIEAIDKIIKDIGTFDEN